MKKKKKTKQQQGSTMRIKFSRYVLTTVNVSEKYNLKVSHANQFNIVITKKSAHLQPS